MNNNSYLCVNCGKKAENKSMYDEECVDGLHCENCDITEVKDQSDKFAQVSKECTRNCNFKYCRCKD